MNQNQPPAYNASIVALAALLGWSLHKRDDLLLPAALVGSRHLPAQSARAWALRAAGVAHPSVATAAAGGVVVVGAGLLSSLWLGRAPGLLPAGIGLAGLSLVASHVQPWFDAPQTSFALLGQRIQDLPARGTVGERRYHPAALSELEPEYSLGFGSVVVDLSDLDLRGETRSIDVRGAIGEATVIVPPHTSVDANGEVGIGEAHAFDRHDEGLGSNVQKTESSDGSGRLQVHVNVGIGKGVVRHAI